MKKIIFTFLTLALVIVGVSSYESADEFVSQEAVTIDASSTDSIEPNARFAAVANGLKFWGKKAVDMFLNNGGGASMENNISHSELESAFD